MTYSRSMILPHNAIIMHEDEMRCLEGGLSLKVQRAYLKKSTCTSLGNKYAGFDGLSSSRIAKEIYAHAFLYYTSSVTSIVTGIMPSLPGYAKAAITSGCNWIRKHSNPIDIGGDNAVRVAIFNVIWKVL